jgi:hypothetical protein
LYNPLTYKKEDLMSLIQLDEIDVQTVRSIGLIQIALAESIHEVRSSAITHYPVTEVVVRTIRRVFADLEDTLATVPCSQVWVGAFMQVGIYVPGLCLALTQESSYDHESYYESPDSAARFDTFSGIFDYISDIMEISQKAAEEEQTRKENESKAEVV